MLFHPWFDSRFDASVDAIDRVCFTISLTPSRSDALRVQRLGPMCFFNSFFSLFLHDLCVCLGSILCFELLYDLVDLHQGF
jgi:hypothetical protein